MKNLNLYAVHFGFEDVFIANVKAYSEEEAILLAHERCKANTKWVLEDGIKYHTKCDLLVEACKPDDKLDKMEEPPCQEISGECERDFVGETHVVV